MGLTRFFPKHFLPIMFGMAFVSILPMLFRKVGADSWAYLVWMDCFAEQFWQGDIYPRWCFNVNAGLGSPVFLLYPPFLFYVAALLHPLTALGLSTYDIVTLTCLLINFCTGITCFMWLRDIVQERFALFASVLLLFMPYHQEMMFFRGVYAEVCALMWLPLLFKYTRRMAMGDKRAVTPLALVGGLLLLTYAQVGLIGWFFSGIYLVLVSGRAWMPKVHFAISALVAAALAAFYLLPGHFYQQFFVPQVFSGMYGWSNSFLTAEIARFPDLLKSMLAVLITSLMLFGAVIFAGLNRIKIEDASIRREVAIWAFMGVLAWCMIFPFSAPVYIIFGPLSNLFFPLRMQNMVTLAIVFIVAVSMQYVFSKRPKQTWKSDFALLLGCLWGMSLLIGASFNAQGTALIDKLYQNRIIISDAFRPVWTDPAHVEADYLLSIANQSLPKTTVVSESGVVKVDKWGWSGITLHVTSSMPITILVNHNYFPLWSAVTDKGENLILHPEDKTGLMMFEGPAGDYKVKMTTAIANGSGVLVVTQLISALAWMGIAWRLSSLKLFDKRGRAW